MIVQQNSPKPVVTPNDGFDVGTVRKHITRVSGFPRPGVDFFDITPLLANAEVFAHVIDHWARRYAQAGLSHVVAIESRGFILGAALATRLHTGLVLLRKPGKLPGATYSVAYTLEYGATSLHMRQDAIAGADRVVIVDDVLATGGTLGAAISLATRCGAHIHEAAVLLEISALEGRHRAPGAPLHSMLIY